MKYFIPMLILLPSWVFAETPADRVRLYYSDIEKGNYVDAAEHYELSQLKEFRNAMEFYKELPLEVQTQLFYSFFGAGHTVESVDKLSDTEFFSAMLKVILLQSKESGGINFNGLEILGEVKEGDNISHVVTRNKVSLGEIELEAMEVVSVKRIGDEWKLLLSGKLKGIPQQFKALFNRNK